MVKFCKKPRTVEVIKKALWNGSIYRNTMPVNLPKALEVVSWTTDATQRILTFLYMFQEFKATPEGFMSGVPRATNAAQAKAAIIEHGTPVRLLQLLFIELGARLVIYNGSECRYVHVPPGLGELTRTKAQDGCLECVGKPRVYV